MCVLAVWHNKGLLLFFNRTRKTIIKKNAEILNVLFLLSLSAYHLQQYSLQYTKPKRPQNLQAKFQYGLSGHVLKSSLTNISEETNATKVTILQRLLHSFHKRPCKIINASEVIPEVIS